MTLKMNDIAKIAGVSRSAVSIALNGKPGISDETRKKIFNIIHENGYTPLRRRKKGGLRRLAVLDLILIKSRNGLLNRSYASLPFFDSLVGNITENVNGFGGKVQIDTLAIDHLENDLDNLQEIKAAIVLATDLTKQQIILIKNRIKYVVFIDNYFADIDADFVSIDNYQGAYVAAKYILKKGYKNIGYVASNKPITNFLGRREGFRSALKERNISIAPDHVYSVDPTLLAPNGELTKNKLSSLPDVLFCEDDYMALRFIKELRKHGVKVPQDIAIMGFDDISEDTMIMPELSTVHVPISQIANQAVTQVLGQVSSRDWLAQKTFVSTRLIERQSL